jgi:rhodanese-related sulfurtransferase
MNGRFIAAGLATLLLTIAVQARELQLPESKRTSLGLYVTAKGAYQKWQANSKSVKMIDVRTVEEFRDVGFPAMAIKIPLTPSEDEFVAQVQQVAKPDDTVLVICRSGNRSAVAVEMLARAGFADAYTVVDGFEGDRNKDPSSPEFGERTVNGWKNAGLPWTRE